ncbi:hypothetical protein [Propionivibrio sp.]|uniref:hypothetical protein n=1 Tax=Propionivibrio sp. TaxID=2212460 RepID=UPI0025E6EE33|nr:hypothetical protein [Propionivibrio sp.]MBK8744091.1 hypothetical protein [Propionivibrio sp.]
MPIFTGTSQEFKRYVGPRLRNFVQMITKKHKAAVGACEHCGCGGQLESAHVKGRDRNQIIDLLLSAISTESVLTVELKQFEKNFKLEHDPVEKAILILCRECHMKYDTAIHSAPSSTVDFAPVAEHSGAVPVIESPDSILPITLEPSQSAEFKRQLLACRHAQITTFHNDGRVEHHPWDASRFSDTSNVMGNLRSRPEFRQGAWRQSGIVKVHVRIVARDG